MRRHRRPLVVVVVMVVVVEARKLNLSNSSLSRPSSSSPNVTSIFCLEPYVLQFSLCLFLSLLSLSLSSSCRNPNAASCFLSLTPKPNLNSLTCRAVFVIAGPMVRVLEFCVDFIYF
ncbi:hypothetical protein Ancab_034298 [Ancistrocladus abbreviatus]